MWFHLVQDVRDGGVTVGGESCEQNVTGYPPLSQCSSSVVAFACLSLREPWLGTFDCSVLMVGPGVLLAGVGVRSATEHPRVVRTVPQAKGYPD